MGSSASSSQCTQFAPRWSQARSSTSKQDQHRRATAHTPSWRGNSLPGGSSLFPVAPPPSWCLFRPCPQATYGVRSLSSFFILNPRISVLSQPQAREDPTTQFKPWQSAERPHRVRFLLLSLGNALDVRTADGHGCFKYRQIVNVTHRARSMEILTWEAHPWPTCTVCYECILLQMLRCDDLMEKDSGKLWWKSN